MLFVNYRYYLILSFASFVPLRTLLQLSFAYKGKSKRIPLTLDMHFFSQNELLSAHSWSVTEFVLLKC